MSADRNLLFGILALQLNFVTRDQLVEGMQAWVLDKTKSLGQIFVTRKEMEADQQMLLDALVAKHVEKHGRNVQNSIQQLSSLDPHTTQLLKKIDDADLQASIGAISAQIEDPHATQPLNEVGSRSASRFRIIRPHARGGLGEVFLAQDTEFSREVALKEIQSRFAHDHNSRERFLREAEITGRLEHPGFVPVYGLGTYDDGRPFYAMKFVRGESLSESINKFHTDPETKAAKSFMKGNVGLKFRELLGRFIDVCNAVHYAHSRGILHRDLKPGNVMIGEYGETLVVDWGLAKILGEQVVAGSDKSLIAPTAGSGNSSTSVGVAIGTPAFMSPEQAEGRIDELGPTTDVYSIGAMLYTLLTGKPPFSGATSEEILCNVRIGIQKFPRSPRLAVPRSLQSICLLAMKTNASRRYPTVAELATDLKLFLLDEPIAKFPESAPEATSRFVRKHKAIALTIFLAIGATATVLLLWFISLNKQFITAGRATAQREIASLKAQLLAHKITGPDEASLQYILAFENPASDNFILEKGDWPENWPRELEGVREQSKTLVTSISRHFAIRFKSREEFERLWPHLLSIRTKGAPVVIAKSPNVFLGDEAGIVVHNPIPERVNALPVDATNFRQRLRHTIYIELVSDGDIIDLNRIQLSTDDLVVDQRFEYSK